MYMNTNFKIIIGLHEYQSILYSECSRAERERLQIPSIPHPALPRSLCGKDTGHDRRHSGETRGRRWQGCRWI